MEMYVIIKIYLNKMILLILLHFQNFPNFQKNSFTQFQIEIAWSVSM